ncbi:chromosomal replication initiator protein DnaA [Streptococcaceae bacterium ESL0729]|nr:chromosomal replication initiator protein DnaA [Streptococcaceae bacterium ESL0729]
MKLNKLELQFWNKIKALARENIKPAAYEYFIETARLLTVDNKEAKILVETTFQEPFWQGQEDLITTAGFEVYGDKITFTLLASDKITDDELALYETTREEAKNPSGSALDSGLDEKANMGIRSDYTFENFVQGEGNKWTLAAAIAASDSPGKLYNPLFIYGGAGLGKTHLMHAIGNEILEDNPKAKVKYVSSETFVNDYVNATRKNKMDVFTNTYRNLDLLLLDDVQFFSGKEGTLNEFFSTFNALYDKESQIVLTSDRLPQELNNLEERLVSRFSWGLTTDITPPDYETRMAILLNLAEKSDIHFDDKTLGYIAGQIDSNIRELEGAFNRVEFVTKTSNLSAANIEMAEKALEGLKAKPNAVKTLVATEEIQAAVARHYDISVEDILGRKRVKQIAFPRQVAMYLSRELTDNSLPKIGTEFGGKDHTTVMYAYDKIKDLMKVDSDLQKDVDSIKSSLK